MVKKEVNYSIKQKMNMEKKSIEELLDKILFIKYSDEEVIGFLKRRILELETMLKNKRGNK